MMQFKFTYTTDNVILVPCIIGSIGAGNRKPVQNGEKNCPPDIKPDLSACQEIPDDFPDTQFLPESFKYQKRTDLFCRCIYIAFACLRASHRQAG